MSLDPVLNIDNIILRQPVESDIEKRIQLGNNPELVKMLASKAGSVSQREAEIWYERVLQDKNRWIIEVSGKMIGIAGLREYAEDNKTKYSIEIYDQHFYGQGIGTKVTKLLLNFAFEELKYHKVFLRVLEYNKRAIRCYEKCGFKVEGVDREGALINGEYYSDVYMGILRSEY